MNNLPIGTLVYLRHPEGFPSPVPQGSFGEIVNGSAYDIPVTQVVVIFQSYPSKHVSKSWSVHTDWLVPIGDSGLISDEDKLDNPYQAKKPVGEYLV